MWLQTGHSVQSWRLWGQGLHSSAGGASLLTGCVTQEQVIQRFKGRLVSVLGCPRRSVHPGELGSQN